MKYSSVFYDNTLVANNFKLVSCLLQLLNGYCDPPAGVTVADGMNFNAYFPGGGIGMAQVRSIAYSGF